MDDNNSSKSMRCLVARMLYLILLTPRVLYPNLPPHPGPDRCPWIRTSKYPTNMTLTLLLGFDSNAMSSVPSGSIGPVLKHGIDSRIPLELKALSQLKRLRLIRVTPSPHFGSCCLQGSIDRDEVAVFKLVSM